MEKYLATIDKEFIDPTQEAGVKRISITPRPAIKIKGYAFEENFKRPGNAR